MSYLESNVLAPFELPPNRVSRELYRGLVTPWLLAPPIDCFSETAFRRHEWDVGGRLTDGQDFFGGSKERLLSDLEKSLSTASMVTRWRAAHKETAGTDEDCVALTMKTIRQAMGSAPGEDPMIRTSGATALLIFRKI